MQILSQKIWDRVWNSVFLMRFQDWYHCYKSYRLWWKGTPGLVHGTICPDIYRGLVFSPWDTANHVTYYAFHKLLLTTKIKKETKIPPFYLPHSSYHSSKIQLLASLIYYSFIALTPLRDQATHTLWNWVTHKILKPAQILLWLSV